jgi:hypothetical protein
MRIGPFVAFVALVSVNGKGQAPSTKPAPNSPEMVAAAMWQKITTTCPVQGSAKPTRFYEEAVYNLLDKLTGRKVTEYSDASTKYLPDQVSEADKKNGIQFRGGAILSCSTNRHIEFDNFNPLAPRAWGEYFDCRGGQMVVNMEQRNGQWFFALRRWKFNPDSIAANKRSCAALTSADPFAAGGVANSARNQSDPKVAPPQIVLSDWVTLSDFALFVRIPTEEFQKAALWQTDPSVADLSSRASGMSEPTIAKTLAPGTRYRASMVNGHPLVIGGAIVVQLEDGRPGLIPEGTR